MNTEEKRRIIENRTKAIGEDTITLIALNPVENDDFYCVFTAPKQWTMRHVAGLVSDILMGHSPEYCVTRNGKDKPPYWEIAGWWRADYFAYFVRRA